MFSQQVLKPQGVLAAVCCAVTATLLTGCDGDQSPATQVQVQKVVEPQPSVEEEGVETQEAAEEVFILEDLTCDEDPKTCGTNQSCVDGKCLCFNSLGFEYDVDSLECKCNGEVLDVDGLVSTCCPSATSFVDVNGECQACDGYGQVMDGKVCSCDAANFFVSDGAGACVVSCNNVNQFHNSTGSCDVCDPAEHFAWDYSSGTCSCDAALHFVSNGEGQCVCEEGFEISVGGDKCLPMTGECMNTWFTSPNGFPGETPRIGAAARSLKFSKTSYGHDEHIFEFSDEELSRHSALASELSEDPKLADVTFYWGQGQRTEEEVYDCTEEDYERAETRVDGKITERCFRFVYAWVPVVSEEYPVDDAEEDFDVSEVLRIYPVYRRESGWIGQVWVTMLSNDHVANRAGQAWGGWGNRVGLSHHFFVSHEEESINYKNYMEMFVNQNKYLSGEQANCFNLNAFEGGSVKDGVDYSESGKTLGPVIHETGNEASQ